ncbi:MAG: hypothetical protein SA339_07430 [Methanomassiliicoccus sp.]|nr:hypothetical protein [Methanomassiliicoccus sp.]
MNSIQVRELEYIYEAIQGAIVPLVATCVAALALWSYHKFHIPSFLLLSASFFLMVIASAIGTIFLNGKVFSYDDSYAWQLQIAIASITLLAFTLLASIYHSEKYAQDIKSTKAQRIVGGLIIAFELAIILYSAIYRFNSLPSFPAYLAAYYLISSVTFVIMIYVVVSLYSIYCIGMSKNTLLVLVGFSCLVISSFVGSLATILFEVLHSSDFEAVYTLSALLGLITVVGYLSFLFALLRLRVL